MAALTVRDYAQQIKNFTGSALGMYEMFKDVAAPDTPKNAITLYLNALPQSALNTFPPFFPATADIADFVLAAGALLEKYFPAPA